MELTVDLSGLGLRLAGPSPAVEAGIRREWAAFLTDADSVSRMVLDCTFGDLGVSAAGAPFEPKRMAAAIERERAQFDMPQGRAQVGADGRATIDLARDLAELEYWTAANLLRACLAWRLLAFDAALVHAACLVVDGRGYLLVGAEGAGKSSWAGLGEAAGARVVSDDLVLCDASGEPAAVLGAPFRSTHRADYRPGRWPLAALLFPRHGATAAWTPIAGLMARGKLLANLPFCDAARDERVSRMVERLASRTPCLELTFALDASFLALLRAGPPMADPSR